MSDWQPIETAPRDQYSPAVLIARDSGNRGVMPAIFDGAEWRALTLVGMMVYANPTHWMPLPEPPPIAGEPA